MITLGFLEEQRRYSIVKTVPIYVFDSPLPTALGKRKLGHFHVLPKMLENRLLTSFSKKKYISYLKN